MSCPFAKEEERKEEKTCVKEERLLLPPICPPFMPEEDPGFGKRWKSFASIVLLGHEKLLQGHSSWYTLNLLLQMSVEEIGAEFGFFGRYTWKEGEPGTPVLKALSYTNIAWTPELQALVQKVNELEFPLLGGGLFAEPHRTGKSVIADPADQHVGYKGVPEGHPPLKNFIGIPIYLGPNLIGEIGFANRNGGWNAEDARFLETWASMMGTLIVQFDDCIRGTKKDPEPMDTSEKSQGSVLKVVPTEEDECPPVTGQSAEVQISPSQTPAHSDDRLHMGERYANEALIQAHMVDTLSDGIIIFDEKMSIKFCNLGATKMLGFARKDDLISCYPSFDRLLFGGLSRSAALNQFDLDQTLRMSSIVATGVRFEAELRKAPVPVTSSHCPMEQCEVDLIITSFELNGCINYTALFRDIGQEKIFRRKDTLLAFLSHEIRNPLQAIIAGSQIQAEKNPSELTDDIYRAANILYSVVNDTIDIVRIHAQKFVPNLVSFNLSNVLSLSMRIYCAAVSPGVVLKKPDIAPDVPQSMMADERRFLQVMGNLLSNATKHTKEGYIQILAEVLPCSDAQMHAGYAGCLRIFVDDTGSGIALEDQPKLFQFFTNIRRSTNSTSTSGLGLLLSRDIARALGGDIWLEKSLLDKGSRFGFCIPFRKDNPADHPGSVQGSTQLRSLSSNKVTTSFPVSKHPKSCLGGLRVLIVDDNELISKIATKILEGSSCICQTAKNGQEALDLLLGPNAKPFDVVLMDCLMPLMDGYTAVAKLRAAGYSGPVLAITGNTAKAETEKALESGYSDVLLKPVKNQELLNKVQHWHETFAFQQDVLSSS